MKSIYKKLSVGVLAAALLVGAGGIAKGGQAFAASKAILNGKSYINLGDYRKAARELDREGPHDFFKLYERMSDRREVVNGLEDKDVEFREVIDKKEIKEFIADEIYGDGWEFEKNIDKRIKSMKEKGQRECKVKVRDLYFIIKLW